MKGNVKGMEGTAKGNCTRRNFLKSSTLAGMGLFLPGSVWPDEKSEKSDKSERAEKKARSAWDKLNIAVIGVAGRGGSNLGGVSGENIVALCDIDQKNLYQASRKFPRARLYKDFRNIFDQKDIDAVVVSTPDHTHAVASVTAMKAGKHVYCEKPLAHNIYEAYVVAKTAVEYRRVTQMGTQIHAGSNYRRGVEMIQTGVIGEVRECHVWVKKTWSGGNRPKETPSVPPHISYDLWLGPAPERPYHAIYLPQNWRRWWEFGGGTLADMGCHHMDVVHWALNLKSPVAVEAEGPPVHPETTPAQLIVRYDHPARGTLPPVRVTWYDGGKRPHYFQEGKLPRWGDGILWVGEKGMMLSDYGRYVLLPEDRYKGYQPPPRHIPESIGHHREWIEACKTGAPTTCNFVYGGALTEGKHFPSSGRVSPPRSSPAWWGRRGLSPGREKRTATRATWTRRGGPFPASPGPGLSDRRGCGGTPRPERSGSTARRRGAWSCPARWRSKKWKKRETPWKSRRSPPEFGDWRAKRA